MQKIILMRSKLIYLLACLAFGVVLSACKKDEPKPKTDEEKQLEKLAATWVLPSPAPTNTVTIQGNDVTAEWTSFEVTFSDGSYSVTGSGDPQVWPGSGSWSFAEGDVATLQRSDGVDISINVSDTNLTMSFNYSASGGRLDGIEGDWVFTGLDKKQ